MENVRNNTGHGSRSSPVTGHEVHQSPATCHEDEINLLDYWRIIRKYQKMIAIIVITASIIAVIASLLWPKSYKAEAVIIPVSDSGKGGLAALASQFGGLASLAGLNVAGETGDAQKFVSILESRTLRENVIKSENLMPVLFEGKWDDKAKKWKMDDPENQPTMEEAVKKMKDLVEILDDKKNNTVNISGEFKTPEIAANVVNAYLEELQKFINSNALTMSKRNRIFIEGQLEDNKMELLEAGKEINEFYKGNKVSTIDSKVDVLLKSNADAKQPIVADLDQPAIAKPQLPELENLIVQKTDIEKKIAEARVVKNVPQQVYLTYLMLRRELLAKVNALLTTQYEMAKIEEAKEDLAFQIIDKAVPPVKRYKPKRGLMCITSFMAALFLAIFVAFFREYIGRMKEMQIR